MLSKDRRTERNGGRGNGLDDDVEALDPPLAIDLGDARLDVAQAGLLGAKRLLDLGALHGEHAAQFLRRDHVLDQRSDLLQRKPKILQRQSDDLPAAHRVADERVA
jgi:hypothetical protein